jgi:phage terminase large subunit-like protein
MLLWDACREPLPHFDRNAPLILAADAAVSGDTFGLVGIGRHPSRADGVAVRMVREWNPLTAPDEYVKVDATGKRQLDFDRIEDDIKNICLDFNVLLIAYDPYQLHQMMTRLRDKSETKAGRKFSGVNTEEVKQGGERLIADKQLLDLILNRRIAYDLHSGEAAALREHLDNADRKLDADGKRLRIVKREEQLKIDLAVSLSMACYKESVLPVEEDRAVHIFKRGR